MTGTRTVVGELLGRFVQQPDRVGVEILANPAALTALRGPELESVRITTVERGSGSRLRRLSAVSLARLGFGPSFAGPIDVSHYPLGLLVPLPDGPSVVTIHDLQHRDLPENFSRGQRIWRDHFLALAVRRATLLVTVSEHARDRLLAVTGLPGERVRAVPSAVDQARFSDAVQPEDQAAREAAGVRAPYLFYPASLWPHKNHAALIEAFARLQTPSLELVLTGATYGREDWLTSVATRFGVAGRVRHLGVVADELMPALYRGAEGLVFPSSYEGFGLPLLEAMACGCPVAASTATALAEVGGEAVITLAPQDAAQMAGAIGRLLGDDALRLRLRQAGLARAATFSWQRAADAYLDAYEQAVQLHHPR